MSDAEPQIHGLHHVALPFPGTTDAIAAARHFYGSLVALTELTVPSSVSGVLWFDAVAGTELHLYTDPEAPAVKSPRHPCLRVSGLDALRDRLRQAGVELLEPGHEISGRTRFFAFDPFGNAVEFAEFE